MKLEVAVRGFPEESGFRVTLSNGNSTFNEPAVQKQLEFLCGNYSGTEELAKKIESRKIPRELLAKLPGNPSGKYNAETLKIIGAPDKGYYLAIQRGASNCYCPLGEIQFR